MPGRFRRVGPSKLVNSVGLVQNTATEWSATKFKHSAAPKSGLERVFITRRQASFLPGNLFPRNNMLFGPQLLDFATAACCIFRCVNYCTRNPDRQPTPKKKKNTGPGAWDRN